MLTNTSIEPTQLIKVRLLRRMTSAVLGGTHWLTPSELGAIFHKDKALVVRWLKEGKLFAIDRDGHQEFPRYVFDDKGIPLAAVQQILQEFGQASPMRVASWFESTSATLNGRRPRELIATEPDSVIAAARLHALGPVHG